MRRVLFSSFAALTFLAAAAGAAGAETPSIPALIGSKKVLVVGESYGRPESARQSPRPGRPREAALKEMGRAGLEPATPAFSVRCSTN